MFCPAGWKHRLLLPSSAARMQGREPAMPLEMCVAMPFLMHSNMQDTVPLNMMLCTYWIPLLLIECCLVHAVWPPHAQLG